MSDSVRPHRRQPTRLPCPWDSPGKNTGVGCHFLKYLFTTMIFYMVITSNHLTVYYKTKNMRHYHRNVCFECNSLLSLHPHPLLSIRLGIFLRRYPIARVFVIIYM